MASIVDMCYKIEEDLEYMALKCGKSLPARTTGGDIASHVEYIHKVVDLIKDDILSGNGGTSPSGPAVITTPDGEEALYMG